MSESLGSLGTLQVGSNQYTLHRLSAAYNLWPQAQKLPFTLKILLENLLRHIDGVTVRNEDVQALASWDAKAEPSREISFAPARG